MKIRETLYYIASLLFGWIMHLFSELRLLTLFGVVSQRTPLLQFEVRDWLRKAGIILFVASLVLLLGVNAVWSYANSKFWPDSDPKVSQFLEDLPNLLNYALLCPLYITFGTTFLFFVSTLRKRLNENEIFSSLGVRIQSPTPVTTAIWVAVAIAATSFSISVYASELGGYDFMFWFQTLSPKGDIVLSAHGYYYLVTNLGLNALTVLVVIAHIELFSVASIVGKGIRDKLKAQEQLADFWHQKDQIVERFAPFTSLYVISKILVVTYLVNMYTWKAQNPHFIGMLDFTVILLALLGAAVVSYPRYHIQYWVFRIWQGDANMTNLYPELRGPIQVGLANLADFLILGGAMSNLLAYVLQKSNISLVFW